MSHARRRARSSIEADGRRRVEPGEAVRFGLRKGRLYLFDAADEQALGPVVTVSRQARASTSAGRSTSSLPRCAPCVAARDELAEAGRVRRRAAAA